MTQQSVATQVPQVTVGRINADGVNVFYREAGPEDAPVVLLLHGFPTSSFQFRELIPLLADRYRVIAPDLPGFGFTEIPADRGYTYNFASIARTIEAFADALHLTKFAIYIFDYGAPTGLRIALAHPERITAIISQNGNAYDEGLGDAWSPIRQYWQTPSQENREALRAILTPESIRWQYEHGTPDPTQVKPEAYTLDAALIARPGNAEIQLDLIGDYQSNVRLYPQFHAYLRKAKPPVLAVWGRNDPFFIPAGAEAFRRDVPDAVVELFDTGHFALETHVVAIAESMRRFLGQHVK